MTTDANRLVRTIVEQLSDARRAVRAGDFPTGDQDADRPGLYAWWADDEGLALLAAPFGAELPPLIYAGQAGATAARSGAERAATLRSRIGGNHLNGNIGSSTFRRTLTAILIEPLRLQLDMRGRLDAVSNRSVSAWMRQHLRVAIVPVEDRTTLAAVELAVLHALDPPLNLMGMRPTPVRTHVRRLRSLLATAPSEPRSVDRTGGSPSTRVVKDEAAVDMTLHAAMVEILRGGEWLTFEQLAREIQASGLYRRKDGGFPEPGQLRMRATLSSGRYAHLFEVAGHRIRLRFR